ncbi:MAG: hypothetical protein B5M53_12560 [Candidatus Cloacimonas sp. 4484_209]|nr:MAG: hypothetical protein B5M53_12560 [Candidatus Cloacimonas sp. 4484_209]
MKGKFTLLLFSVTFLVFIYQIKTGVLIGLNPSDLHYEDFIIYAFFHSSSTHFAFNLAALLFLGYYLEEKIGTDKFIVLFFITTIFAGIVYVLIYPSADRLCVGLSGFIFGIVGGNIVAYKEKYRNYFLLSALFYISFTVFLIYFDIVGIGCSGKKNTKLHDFKPLK